MDSLKQIERRAQHDPFNTVLIPFSQGLPDSFFLRSLSSDTDSSSPPIRTRWILLNFAKFDALRRDIVASIGEVKHAPKCCIWVGFGDLEQREIRRIGRRERKLVYWRDDTGIGN